MTWSTRTAVQCTGVAAHPDCRCHAPMWPGRAGSLVASCWSELLWRAPVRRVAGPPRRSVRSSSRLPLRCPPRCSALPLPAAADLNAPDRASVPAEINASEAHALPGDATNVRIDMTENDGLDVIVAASGGAVVGAGGARCGGRPVPTGRRGRWDVETGASCGGPWSAPVLTNQTNPTASPVGGLLTLCVASGSPTVHGTFTAMYNSLGQARSVNTLPLEQYVADTVPGESPSSWASLGGAGPQGMNWGFQELEAQAVAVRSYVLANLGGYGGYADTCDLTCQTYRGTAVRDADEHRGGQRHRRAGDDHAGRPDRHHRVLRLDGRLHLERQPAVALHRRARRRRRRDRRRRATPTTTGRPRSRYTAIQSAWSRRSAPSTGFGGLTSDPGQPVRLPVRAGCHHHARRDRLQQHHHPGDRVLRRPRAQVGPLHP